MLVELKFGDIVDIQCIKNIDGGRKLKIAVCVESKEWWFFCINSTPYSFAAQDTIELCPSDLDRLPHKSYLSLYGPPIAADKIEIDFIDMSKVYRFKNQDLYKAIMYKLQHSRLLSPDQKLRIYRCYTEAGI